MLVKSDSHASSACLNQAQVLTQMTDFFYSKQGEASFYILLDFSFCYFPLTRQDVMNLAPRSHAAFPVMKAEWFVSRRTISHIS